MAIYSIYHRRGDAADRAVFVKEGFSGPALVFTVFWALWHRMWIVAAVMLCLIAAVSLLAEWSGLAEDVIAIVNLAIGLIIGFEAASIRGWSLLRSGFAETGVVQAATLEEAELKYYLGRKTETAVTASTPPKLRASEHGEPLGLFGTP
jgi:hypothetical protein